MMLYCCIEDWLVKNLEGRLKIEKYSMSEGLSETFVIGIFNLHSLGDLGSIMDTLWWGFKKGEVSRLIIYSNYGVYKPECKIFREDSETHPKNLPGLFAEELERFGRFVSERFQKDVVVFRLFNLYGPFQPSGYIVADLMNEVLSSKYIKIGDQRKIRDFLYVEDFLVLMENALKNFPKGFNIFNVGSGKATMIRELVEKIISISGKNIEIIFDPTRIRDSYDYDSAVADISKAQKFFKWNPQYDLNTGLKLTYQWYLGQR